MDNSLNQITEILMKLWKSKRQNLVGDRNFSSVIENIDNTKRSQTNLKSRNDTNRISRNSSKNTPFNITYRPDT